MVNRKLIFNLKDMGYLIKKKKGKEMKICEYKEVFDKS